MLTQVARTLGAERIMTVDEPTRSGMMRNAAMDLQGRVPSDDGKLQRLGTQWRGTAFPLATDPDCTQILDNVLLDAKTRLVRFEVFRQEVLGGTGPVSGSNLPPEAISDHAGLMVTLGYR